MTANVAGLLALASYLSVTVLLCFVFTPVSWKLSLLAALFSTAGLANGMLQPFHILPIRIHSLVFFGFCCLLSGYLILRSAFLPRFVGVLMAAVGVGWLTFLSAGARRLARAAVE